MFCTNNHNQAAGFPQECVLLSKLPLNFEREKGWKKNMSKIPQKFSALTKFIFLKKMDYGKPLFNFPSYEQVDHTNFAGILPAFI